MQNVGGVCTLVELDGQKKSSATVICHFLIKANIDRMFLTVGVLPSDVTWKYFCSARDTLNKFAIRPGITSVFNNVTQLIFLSRA